MLDTQNHTATESHIDVTLDHDGIINCVMHGNITEALVKKSMQETAQFVRDIGTTGKTKPLLLIDASNVVSQTSGARQQAKLLNKMGIEKIAICGPNPALSLVVQYLIRSGGMAKYARIFRTKAAAKIWLRRKKIGTIADSHIAHIVCAVIVATGAIASLVGWAIDNSILTSLIPGLKPVNPISALTLFVIALGVATIKKYGQGNGFSRIIPFFAGIWAIFFSTAIVLRNALSVALPIDEWLFTQAVQNTAPASLTAPHSAYMFMCLGVMLICVLTGQKKTWQRVLFAAASTGAFLIPLSAIINYGFGIEFAFVTPASLIIVLSVLILNYGLQTVARQVSIFTPIWQKFHKYSPALFVGASLATVGGIAWQQSVSDLDRNTNAAIQQEFSTTEAVITEKVNGYINTLRGFKSFYMSSDNVTPPEFRTYFRTSNIEENYPGFTAITFVPSIDASQRNAFNTTMRREFTSPAFPNYKNFTIYPVTTRDKLYPTTIVEPSTPTTVFGFDLGSNETRVINLERARDTGDIATSDSIDLNARLNDPSADKRLGFYLTIPIYNKGSEPTTLAERQSRIYGFVNALFESSKLFGNIFSEETNKSVKYVVSNARSGEIMYTHNGGDPAIENELKFTKNFFIGGQAWRLDMYTIPLFGTTSATRNTPIATLITGAIFTILASSLMVMQLRRKDHALQLAENMTEDLNNERNEAVVAKQKDEAVLSSIGDAVFAIDTNGKITLFNPASEKISGFTKDEAIGRHYRDILKFILEKDGSIHDSFITKALDGYLSSMKNHTQLIRKDGTKVAVADSAAPIRNANGKILGAIIVFRDVTKEKELDRAKTEFVSLASHQLRTPLSAIGWYSEMLLNGDAGKLSPRQKEQITEIYEGNLRMVELVNSLLNASRLELGKLQNDAAPTSLVEITHSLEQELLPTMRAKKQEFETHIDEKLPTVTADPKLLRMIVQNLLSNAVKYTPEKGKVTMTLHAATKEAATLRKLNLKQPPHNYVFFKVADTGFGIPKAQHDKIFQKLFRADNVRALEVEGTGLGLYIVREIIQKLGGKIWFESEEGKGTTFYVILPIVTKSTVSNS